MPRLLGTALARRRWANFRANRRAWWSVWIFGVLFVLCLFAEFFANDRPLLVSYRGDWYAPVFRYYAETEFGGEFETEAEYPSPEVQCLIHTGGLPACLDDPLDAQARAAAGEVDGRPVERGWMLWPPIPYSFNTINYDVSTAPGPPDANHWFGTDDQTRDVLARIIYGFRISTLFALAVVVTSSALGIAAGAAMGYFGGWVDLLFQRLVEILAERPEPLRHHHPVGAVHHELHAAHGADRAVQLDLPGGGGAGPSSCARATSSTPARRGRWA